VTENEIGAAIVSSAMKVHTAVGPGLLESAYEICMKWELESRRLSVCKQVPVAVRYADREIPHAYRVDLLVNDKVVIELKAVQSVTDTDRAQLISYLRLGKFKLGYLLNFHVARMRDGITRYVNGL
jgi:GxxExxY protein